MKSNFLKIGNTILFFDYDYSRTGLFGYLFFENVDFYNADFPKMVFIRYCLFKKLDLIQYLNFGKFNVDGNRVAPEYYRLPAPGSII
jgi:hypothetical protein